LFIEGSHTTKNTASAYGLCFSLLMIIETTSI
jgi:hypothetical protein